MSPVKGFMKAKGSGWLVRFTFGVAVAPALWVLDIGKFISDRLRGNTSRVLQVLAILVLGGVTLNSLTSLREIIRQTTQLNRDSLVGVEAAIEMRRTVVGLHMDFIRDGAMLITPERLEEFQARFGILYKRYLDGVFEERDQDYAKEILEAEKEYMLALRLTMAAVRASSDGAINPRVDMTLRRLLSALDVGLDYNGQRLHESAVAVRDSAMKALQVSGRIWLAATVLFVVILLTLMINWLLRTEDMQRDS